MQAYAEPNRVDLERQEENKMGRPVNKSKIGQGAGKISVTAYRFVGASEVLSSATQAWITKQNGSREFLVSDGSTTEELRLVNKSAGELAEGEMIINCQDDGTVGTMQVTSIRNRRVQVEGAYLEDSLDTNDGGADDSVAPASYPYTVSNAPSADAESVTVDSQ